MVSVFALTKMWESQDPSMVSPPEPESAPEVLRALLLAHDTDNRVASVSVNCVGDDEYEVVIVSASWHPFHDLDDWIMEALAADEERLDRCVGDGISLTFRRSKIREATGAVNVSEDWVSYVDDATGIPFYHNVASGHTVWEMPDAETQTQEAFVPAPIKKARAAATSLQDRIRVFERGLTRVASSPAA